VPEKGLLIESSNITRHDTHTASDLFIGRGGRGDRVPVTLISPVGDDFRWIIVLVSPEGRSRYLDAQHNLKGLAKTFVDKRYSVVLLDPFSSGASDTARRDHLAKYFSTYNRTDLQERVQDIITTCAFAQTHGKGRKVLLVGTGHAGLSCMLAAPAAQALAADYDRFNDEDSRLMQRDLFVPGIRRIAVFQGAAALAAPNPVLVHNAGDNFKPQWLKASYAAVQSSGALRIKPDALSDVELADWVGALPSR
jgi:dienelactone hydrolase